MTNYAAVDAIADARVRAAIAAGVSADAPPGVAVTARDDGLALAGRRIGERWQTDMRLRAIGDAVRAAAR